MEDKNKELKENKKEDVKKEEKKVDIKQETKNVEAKKEEPKFQKVDKKEAKKKENKKEGKKETKKTWIPTVITVVIVLLVAALLTVMIVTSSAPKKSLDALLTNLKAGDFEKAQQYLSGDMDLSTDTLDQETQKLLFDKLNWKINKVTEKDENNATIEVEITTKNFQTIVNNYYAKALEAVKGAITGNNSTESFSSQDFENYFIEELKNDEIETTTVTTTVNAVKEDKEWKIVSDNSLINALLPGLEETVNSLS